MNNNLTVTKSIEINADVKKVWDALTNPAKIKEYLFGTETITDWKAGSPIIFQGEYQGQKYKDKGTILNLKQEELLTYDYWSGFSGLEDKPENYSLVSYMLNYANNKTVLTVTQTGFADEKSHEHSLAGWTQVVEKIKEISER